MRYLTAGESHGKGLIGIVEGLPAGLKVDSERINAELKRRQLGYGRGGRMKIESDRAEIISGIRGGITLGSPISFFIKNSDYESWKGIMGDDADRTDLKVLSAVRPGHADLPGCIKYGFDDARNVLERASARETAARVASGAFFKLYLEELGIFTGSHVISLGGVDADIKEPLNAKILIENADKSEVRCMDGEASHKMKAAIDEAKAGGDTLGGICECIVSGVPAGIGSYVQYDRRLDYKIAAYVMAVHSVKSVEIGLGAKCAYLKGSQVHDEIFTDGDTFYRTTNNAGGIEGGISNGSDIVIKAAFKPIPTLMRGLNTVDIRTGKQTVAAPERSDCCAVPAGGVVMEAVVAAAIAELTAETLGGDSMDEVKERMAKMRERKWKLKF